MQWDVSALFLEYFVLMAYSIQYIFAEAVCEFSWKMIIFVNG